jgi:hypothetical protein
MLVGLGVAVVDADLLVRVSWAGSYRSGGTSVTDAENRFKNILLP